MTTALAAWVQQPKAAWGRRPVLSAQQVTRLNALAASEAYWARKAHGRYPTEQNGRLDGGMGTLVSHGEFFQQLARRVGVDYAS